MDKAQITTAADLESRAARITDPGIGTPSFQLRLCVRFLAQNTTISRTRYLVSMVFATVAMRLTLITQY